MNVPILSVIRCNEEVSRAAYIRCRKKAACAADFRLSGRVSNPVSPSGIRFNAMSTEQGCWMLFSEMSFYIIHVKEPNR